MSDIERALDKLIGAWRLADEDGPITSGSGAMSDLVDDIMRVVRDNLAATTAEMVSAHIRTELGALR